MPNTLPPTVVHIPHASQVIPPEILASYVISPSTLATELLRMTDHYTDELFGLPAEVAATVAFPVSRLVVDPERFVDDTQEPMSAKGMGVVYTRTSDGKSLRSEPFSALQREALLKTYYFPHHKALSAAVAAALEKYATCLLIDGHSFSTCALPHEYDQRPNRPDICIGTYAFHSPSWLPDLAIAVFREHGFKVEVNQPFAGTIVPQPFFQRNPQVLSVMIEINRTLYMVEENGHKLPDFVTFAAVMRQVLVELITRANVCAVR